MGPLNFYRKIKELLGISQSIHRFMLGRLGVITALFAFSFLYQLFQAGWDFSSPLLIPLYGFMVVTYLASLLFSLLAFRVKKTKRFIASLLGVDTLFITVFVYLTGTAGSYFSFLYLASITLASLLFARKGALATAALSGAFYSLLMVLDPLARESGIILNLLIHNGAFFGVGLIVGYVAEELKITGLKLFETEENLRLSEKQAAIGKMVAGIAHEIRNPLASVSGSVEMLKQNTHLEPEERRLIDIVTREVNRLNNLISELLEYTRPVKKSDDVYQLEELVQETLLELQHHKAYGVDIKLEKNIPFSSIPMRGNRSKLKQVFWNLFINACQAMGGRGTLSVTVGEAHDRAEIRVRDTGEGIPAENLGKIFDAFFSTKDEGTGLGLAVVQKIIESHGGIIRVDSQLGQGTEFRVILPKPHVLLRAAAIKKEQVA